MKAWRVKLDVPVSLLTGTLERVGPRRWAFKISTLGIVQVIDTSLQGFAVRAAVQAMRNLGHVFSQIAKLESEVPSE